MQRMPTVTQLQIAKAMTTMGTQVKVEAPCRHRGWGVGMVGTAGGDGGWGWRGGMAGGDRGRTGRRRGCSVRCRWQVGGGRWQVRDARCAVAGVADLLAEGEAKVAHDHLPEDRGELLMSEAQGPQPQVGGCVGDAAEHVLDAVDDLVDHHLGEVKLLLVVLTVAVTGDAAAVVVLHEALRPLRVSELERLVARDLCSRPTVVVGVTLQ